MRAAASNFAGSLALQGGLRAARLTSLLVAAYLLSTDDFAALAIALALTDLARVSLQAFDVAALRARGASDRSKSSMRVLTAAKILVAIAFGGASIVLCALLYGSLAASSVAVLSLGVVFGALAALWMVPAQSNLRLLSMTPAVLSASVVTVVAATVGATTGSPLGVAVGLVVGDVVLLALVARKERFVPDFELQRVLAALRESPRLMVQQFGYVGQFRFGTLALGVLASPLAVAEYALASRLAEGLMIVSAAITATSYPVMVRALAAHGRAAVLDRFVPAHWLAVGVSTVTVFLMVLTVPLWLPVVLPKYPGAAVPFALVGLGVIAMFSSAQTTVVLNTLRRDSVAAATALLGLGTNVTGVLLLAGSTGAIGVACSRLAGEALRTVAEILAVRSEGSRRLRLAWGVWLAMAPLLTGIVLAVVSEWDTRVLVASGLLGGTASVLATLRYWPRLQERSR